MNARGDEGADWPFPRSVPSCISLHLKTCEEERREHEAEALPNHDHDRTLHCSLFSVLRVAVD